MIIFVGEEKLSDKELNELRCLAWMHRELEASNYRINTKNYEGVELELMQELSDSLSRVVGLNEGNIAAYTKKRFRFMVMHTLLSDDLLNKVSSNLDFLFKMCVDPDQAELKFYPEVEQAVLSIQMP